MTLDMKQRQSLARVDDDARQQKVSISRSHIYDQGYGVRSNVVENLLKEHSLVPTSVIHLSTLLLTHIDHHDDLSECVFGETCMPRFQSIHHAGRRPHA